MLGKGTLPRNRYNELNLAWLLPFFILAVWLEHLLSHLGLPHLGQLLEVLSDRPYVLILTLLGHGILASTVVRRSER